MSIVAPVRSAASLSSSVPAEATQYPVTDIAIVGSGISGTLAAVALARAGHSVTLIDRYPVYPTDFRAEHLDGPMIEQLRRLGFLSDLTADLYRGETVAVAKDGRVIANATTINYGLRYESLVNRARAMLPPHVRQVTGKVAAVSTSAGTQAIRMADGQVFTARLLVLATGHGHALPRQLGIRRRIIREGHSLTFGFYIEPEAGNVFRESFVVYQRERIRDRMDYLAAFIMGAAMRVNLFTYRNYKEDWTRSFLADPDAGLRQVMPGLTSVIGAYRACGPVAARPVDLYVLEDYRKDGVVLVGDAFQMSCPATGMGMVKVLNDIERLATVHAPKWLTSPGMGAEKISAFYDDPVKRSVDAKALHDAEYRRSVSTETSLRWRLHRTRIALMEYARVASHRPPGVSNPRINAGHAETSLAPG